MTNHAEAFHGLDSHALRTDAMHFGPVEPGKAMRIQKTVDTPGVFMYHCADGPSTDYHVKSGLAGAMIVYPRNRLLRGARELVIVESAVFGEADASGEINGHGLGAHEKERAFDHDVQRSSVARTVARRTG
jgi:nitrite reductase (NO-forming)